MAERKCALRKVWDNLVVGDVIETNLTGLRNDPVVVVTVCFKGEDAILAFRDEGGGRYSKDRWLGFDDYPGAVLRVIRKQSCEFCKATATAHVEGKFVCTKCYQEKILTCSLCSQDVFCTGAVEEMTSTMLTALREQESYEERSAVANLYLFKGAPVCVRCTQRYFVNCALCKKIGRISTGSVVIGRQNVRPCESCFDEGRNSERIIACQRCHSTYVLICPENLEPASSAERDESPRRRHVCHGCRKPSFEQKTGGLTAVNDITQRLIADKPLMRVKASYRVQIVGYPEIQAKMLRVPLVVVPTGSARSIYCSVDIIRFVVKHLTQQEHDGPTILGRTVLANKAYGVCQSSKTGTNTLKIPRAVIEADPEGVVNFVELVGMAE